VHLAVAQRLVAVKVDAVVGIVADLGRNVLEPDPDCVGTQAAPVGVGDGAEEAQVALDRRVGVVVDEGLAHVGQVALVVALDEVHAPAERAVGNLRGAGVFDDAAVGLVPRAPREPPGRESRFVRGRPAARAVRAVCEARVVELEHRDRWRPLLAGARQVAVGADPARARAGDHDLARAREQPARAKQVERDVGEAVCQAWMVRPSDVV